MRVEGAVTLDHAQSKDSVETAEDVEASVDGTGQENGRGSSRSRKSFIIAVSVLAIGIAAVVVLLVVLLIPKGNPGVSLPDGFPSQGQLPLVSGEQTAADDLEGAQKMVTVQVSDLDVQQGAVDELVNAGYEVLGVQGSGPVGTVTSLVGDGFAVRVEYGMTQDGEYTVTYITSPTTKE